MAAKNQKNSKDVLTVNDIRHNNMVNIFTEIVSADGIRKNDLAGRNNISLVTVNTIVNDLVKAGFAEERVCNTSVGRKPMEIHVDSRYGSIVCINLSSVHEIRYIIYNLRGDTLRQNGLTFRIGAKDTLEERIGVVLQEIGECLRELCLKVAGVAAFIPGVYYEDTDEIRYALYEELTGIRLHQILEDAFHVSNICILHDTFASAESEYESTRETHDSQFYLYCGDGVGSCFMTNGRPITGSELLAGEVGNCIMTAGKDSDLVRLEELISIQGILRKLPHEHRYREMEALIRMAEEGEEEIIKILSEAYWAVAVFISNIIWLYNPSKIVIDSCCSEYADRIIEYTGRFFQEQFGDNMPTSVEIRKAKCDEFHTMKGCLRHVRKRWIEEVISSLDTLHAE